jgi:hypothetical protein
MYTAYAMLASLRQHAHRLSQAAYNRGLIRLGTFPGRDQFTTINNNVGGSLTATDCYEVLSVSVWVPCGLHIPQTVQTCQHGEIAIGPNDFGGHHCFCSRVLTGYGITGKLSIDQNDELVLGLEALLVNTHPIAFAGGGYTASPSS